MHHFGGRHAAKISVSSALPGIPGKAVQLELKTTTVIRSGQEVKIDLVQLDIYLSLRHHKRPFYVFPLPLWVGVLEKVKSSAVYEVGFSRSDESWWFANWLFVLTADEVATILKNKLYQHQKNTNKKPSKAAPVTLVTIASNGGRDCPEFG